MNDRPLDAARGGSTKKPQSLEGFWSYAKAKFLKHHGVGPQKFPLYFYEWQFRYNHRDEDLFALFLKQSLKLLPDL